MKNLKQILSRENFGLVLRVFAGKPEAVAVQCDRTLALARKAHEMKSSEKNVFSRILIMVASDTRRIDHDCGESFSYLKSQLTKVDSRIQVVESTRDDLFCGILNDAAGRLRMHGCNYMAVFSNAAHEYLDVQYMEDSAEAFLNGAAATALAITELQESIMNGALANTAIIWKLEDLQAVGGFDQFAEQPYKTGHRDLFTDERLVGWVQDERPDGKDSFYPIAGVEEIIPLIRMTRRLDRPCLAPIMPASGKVWEAPTDADELARHNRKMLSKTTRQSDMAGRVNATTGLLRNAVMDGYGWK